MPECTTVLFDTSGVIVSQNTPLITVAPGNARDTECSSVLLKTNALLGWLKYGTKCSKNYSNKAGTTVPIRVRKYAITWSHQAAADFCWKSLAQKYRITKQKRLDASRKCPAVTCPPGKDFFKTKKLENGTRNPHRVWMPHCAQVSHRTQHVDHRHISCVMKCGSLRAFNWNSDLPAEQD